MVNNTLYPRMTAIESSLKDNSLLDLGLEHNHLFLSAYRISRNNGSKNSNGNPLKRSRLQNLSLVSEKDLKEELFLAYLINSPLIKALSLLEGWNDSKGIYKYLLRGFWKVENCSTLEEVFL